MTALSSTDLTNARADALLFLTDAVTVRRFTPGTSSTGGQTAGTTADTVTVGRIARGADKPDETQIAERLAAVETWTVVLPHGTDVRVTDKIIHNSITYEVVALSKPRTQRITLRALVKKV